MKKIILFTMTILALCSCSKDDDENKDAYRPEVAKVINVLSGKWRGEGHASDEVLTFVPFGELKWINGTIGGVMWFHGKATRQFLYLDKTMETWNMYFYVDVEKKKIGMNGETDDGKFSIVPAIAYEYTIKDDNTISLHDTSLSWIHEYDYHRIR